ncbi:MAG TPA: acyltransferase [Patescibacteria group bacterium]|nr:acyltransferase [Patescibacteria group bacterium]
MGILRVLFAVSVYFIHTGWIKGFVLFPDIITPVNGFFIISGFYMAFILNRKYVGKKSSYRLFITNRLLRIYPIYWVILLLSLLFYAVVLLLKIHPPEVYAKDLLFSWYIPYYSFLLQKDILMLPVAIAADIFRNVTLVFHCGYFVRCAAGESGYLTTTGQAWSLNHELLFYLIAPFLLRRKGFIRFGVIAGAFLLWYLFFHFQWLDFDTSGYIFLTALTYFMFGYLNFLLYETLPMEKMHPLALSGICLFVCLFALLYFRLPIPSLQYKYKWMNIHDYIYYGTIAASLPFLFQFSSRIRFDGFIGQLSYPLYISHILANEVLAYTHIAQSGTLAFILIGLLFAILFSFAVTYLLEKPIDIYRQRRVAVVDDQVVRVGKSMVPVNARFRNVVKRQE